LLVIAALSDLRAGTSSWIPGGNQVKGEGKKPEKAQVMMQGLWTPFLQLPDGLGDRHDVRGSG
jgi:hypothetical protein